MEKLSNRTLREVYMANRRNDRAAPIDRRTATQLMTLGAVASATLAGKPSASYGATDRLGELIADSTVKKVASGFQFTEGPIWMPDGSLHFSDVVGDARWRWHPTQGPSVLRRPSNKCNGMTLDGQGNLLVCEHTTSRVVKETRDGKSTVIASHFQGKELNSPNDVIVASDGSVIFTDPTYGRLAGFGLERPVVLGFSGVYRIAPQGNELELLSKDFGEPNGLCLSADEKLLYVNDTPRAHIRVFDVGPGYRLTGGRIFAANIGNGDIPSGVVDGMKIDERGNVYVTGPKGLWVFDPKGQQLGTIPIPENAANLNWGGPDWRTLYVTAGTSVYQIQMNVSGGALAYMKSRR